MDIKNKCDVLVIGAGPAGASLAYFLARDGIDTILIDKKTDPGNPVRCAEYVPQAISRLYDFPIEGIDLAPSAMTTFIGYSEAGTIKAPGFMLDRHRFSGWLIKSFLEKKGLFLGGARASCFWEEKDAAGACVICGGEEYRIYPKFIVGADGPASAVGRHIGSTNKSYVLGLNENIPAEARDMDRTMVFFSPDIPGGYGWLFPKKGTINLGIGCQAPPGSAERSLDLKGIYSLFKHKISSMGLVKAGSSGKGLTRGIASAGLIPSSGMLEHAVRGRFILAGDAAGLSNPITGAGIYNAVLSAVIISNIIGRAIKEEKPGTINTIQDEYRTAFGISLSRASGRRAELLSRWDRDTDDFSSLVKDTWVGFKPYWGK
jgi:digeranylgeranylglycerophospholipid reductase